MQTLAPFRKPQVCPILLEVHRCPLSVSVNEAQKMDRKHTVSAHRVHMVLEVIVTHIYRFYFSDVLSHTIFHFEHKFF